VAVDLAWSRDLEPAVLIMLEEFGNLLAAIVPAWILARVRVPPLESVWTPGKAGFRTLVLDRRIWGFAAINVLMFALYGLHDIRVWSRSRSTGCASPVRQSSGL